MSEREERVSHLQIIERSDGVRQLYIKPLNYIDPGRIDELLECQVFSNEPQDIIIKTAGVPTVRIPHTELKLARDFQAEKFMEFFERTARLMRNSDWIIFSTPPQEKSKTKGNVSTKTRESEPFRLEVDESGNAERLVFDPMHFGNSFLRETLEYAITSGYDLKIIHKSPKDVAFINHESLRRFTKTRGNKKKSLFMQQIVNDMRNGDKVIIEAPVERTSPY